jgi:hypothetical protein
VIEQPTDTMAFLSSPLYRLASWYGLCFSAAWVMYRFAPDGNMCVH